MVPKKHNKKVLAFVQQLAYYRGTLTRKGNATMVQIEVKQRFQDPLTLSVVEDGYCNHANYEIEREQFQDNNPHGPDQVWYDNIRVCQYRKCHASSMDEDGAEWVNERLIEPPVVFTNAILIQDIRSI